MRFPKAIAVSALLPLLFLAVFQLPVAHAVCATPSPDPSIPCEAPVFKNITIYSILDSVVSILFYILMFASVIMILMAAFNFLTAGGDQEKVTKARSAIVYAIVAIIIAVLARSIPFIVKTFIVGY